MKVCAVISSLLKATFNESFVLKSYKMNFSVTDNIDEIDSNCLIANNNLQFSIILLSTVIAIVDINDFF